MDMRRQVVALTALLALAATGCGSQDSSDTTSADPGSAPTSTPTSAGPVDVESVTMQQSGGIAGLERSWRITSGTPGAERVFAAAQDELLRDAAGSKSTPVCCDFFVYRIVIHFSDGESLQLISSDGQQADPAVSTLLDAVLAAPAGPPDR